MQAAFTAAGKPSAAAEGFARACGTTVAELGREKTAKGEWLSFNIREHGKAAAALLPSIAAQALNRLPTPKRMRWGGGEVGVCAPGALVGIYAGR